MADGFTGGLLGDLPQEDRDRLMASTFGQIGSLLLAAGQKQMPAQRAQYLAQLGNVGQNIESGVFRAQQARLMGAQMQEKMRDISELNVIRDRQKSDPEGLAKAMSLNLDLVKSLDAASLRDIAKQVTIKRATAEPSQVAITEAFQRAGASPAAAAGVSPSQAAVEGPQTTPPGTAPAGQPATTASPPAPSDPRVASTIAAYREALRDPRIIANPKMVKEINDAIVSLDPSAAKYQEEFAKEVGTAKGKEQASAPKALETSERMLGQIDNVLKHPGLYVGTGPTAFTQYIPGTSMRDLRSRISELTGSTFLQAYESLKGTGQITEIEGKKATDAISRLNDPYVKTEDYRQALYDLRSVVQNAQSKANKLLGGQSAPAPKEQQQQPRIRRYNPETGTLE